MRGAAFVLMVLGSGWTSAALAAPDDCASALAKTATWTPEPAGENRDRFHRIEGDFDGSGRGVAVLGRLRGAPTVAVCLGARRRKPIFIALDCPDRNSLLLTKPGHRVLDLDHGPVRGHDVYRRLEHDAITVECDEKAAKTYVFRRGKPRGFLSSD